jgi:zinc resistance-associated protein
MIGLSAIGALATAGALAQEGPRARDHDRGNAPFQRGARMSPEDRAAFVDARVAALHAGLKLTPEQEKLWPPVEDAMRNMAKQRQEARAARRERFASMREQGERSVPDMLRFMADRQSSSADALRKLADASAPLYAALDEAQKGRLNVLARGLVRESRGGGMHRWHQHHHHDRG